MRGSLELLSALQFATQQSCARNRALPRRARVEIRHGGIYWGPRYRFVEVMALFLMQIGRDVYSRTAPLLWLMILVGRNKDINGFGLASRVVGAVIEGDFRNPPG